MILLSRKVFSLVFLTSVCNAFCVAQTSQNFDRVEPPNWWVGMKSTELQILFYVHDGDLSTYEASINYPGISVKEKIKVENPHYLFLTLQVSPSAKAGVIPIQFKGEKKS